MKMKSLQKVNMLSVNSAFAKNTIIAFFLMLGVTAFSQSFKSEAKGKVIDAATGLPIQAAQINILDKNNSAVTDSVGNFTIEVVSKNDVLTVSAYGYNKRELSLRGKSEIVIKLYPSVFSNYFKNVNTTTSKVDQAYSTSSVKTIPIIERPTAYTADQIIANELAGDVRGISRSGTAAIGSSLFIRGINSLNANAQPLFIVDGVIWNNFQEYASIQGGYFSNPLDNIDAQDIESISVIKDGTTIYGSKGANGVIIINTKRSKSMVTKISANITTGVVEQPGLLPMMDGEEFRLYASDMLYSAGFEGIDLSAYPFLNADPAQTSYNSYHSNTDWAKSVYQQGSAQNYLINAQGGDDKAMYYFSLGYSKNDGVIKTTDFSRLNARFNADMNLFDKLKMGLNIGFTRNERSMIDDGVNDYSSPGYLAAIKAPFLSPFSFTNEGNITANYAQYDVFGVGNPEAIIDNSINYFKKYRFNISFIPTYIITPNLTLSSQFDYSLYKTVEGHFVPMLYTMPQYLQDKGYSFNQISSQVIRNSSIFNETKLNYNKTFDKVHQLNALIGFRYINNYYESDFVREHNSGSNNNTTITGSYDFLEVNGINDRTKSISNYLSADYAYDNRYFATIAASMDASSRFGSQTEGGIQLFGASWGLFPSVQGAWLISSEEFMKSVNAVSFLKLRAGFGVTGNDGIPDYQTSAYFNTVRLIDKANGLVIGNLANEKVQWETNAKANLGVDLGLFDDVLNVNLDLYQSNISNMLVLRELPYYSGLSYFWDNGGSMQNSGFEISANVKLVNTKSFQWEAGLTAGKYRNKVTSLIEGDYTMNVFRGQVLTAVGESFGSFYGYKTNGVFSTQDQADAAGLTQYMTDGTYAQFNAGDVIFDDVNGDKIIDSNDKQILGNSNPELYGNLNTKMNYKRFTLNALFTYSYGNDVYNYYRQTLESGAGFYNQTKALNSRWTADGQTTSIPKATYGDPMGNSRFSDRWIEDGSYLKFKNISLSYELPLKSDYIEGLNLWVSAENLYTWTNYLGLDPEVSVSGSQYMQGIDAGLIPLTRAYYVGLKLNL